MLWNAADWRTGFVAENKTQRLLCRMLRTGEQEVWLRMKFKGHCRMLQTGEQAMWLR